MPKLGGNGGNRVHTVLWPCSLSSRSLQEYPHCSKFQHRGVLVQNHRNISPQYIVSGDANSLGLLGPMRQHSRWSTGIDLLPDQLARSL
jgi:hypothetical protein